MILNKVIEDTKETSNRLIKVHSKILILAAFKAKKVSDFS